MAKGTAKGFYTVENPKKYFGGDPTKVIFRSSWEFTMMQEFDRNPSVIAWSSESCSIPYYNPMTKRQTVYIPDFLIVYEDRTGKKHAEMIEVKPAKETPNLNENVNKKLSKKDLLAQALNAIKWESARKFCDKRGMKFRIMTEYDIYKGMKKRQ